MGVLNVCMHVCTVGYGGPISPSAPEINEKRKADRLLVQVHQTNSRAVTLLKD